MNGMINYYKKIACALLLLVAFNISAIDAERCSACQGNALLKQSIKDAMAAAIAAEKLSAKPNVKPNSKEMELDDMDGQQEDAERCNACHNAKILQQQQAAAAAAAALAAAIAAANNKPVLAVKPSLKPSKSAKLDNMDDAMLSANQPCCAYCEQYAVNCQNKKDGCSKIERARAPREALTDPCTACGASATDPCPSLPDQLQELIDDSAVCCAVVNHISNQIKNQSREAKKCCSKIKNKIEDVEELIISQTDASAACCSVVDNIQTLAISQIDSSAACCSVIDNIQVLAISQIDQSANCCSIIETRIGSLGETVFDTPTGDIVTFVNGADFDVITWLKGIYALLFTVFNCTCT